MSMPSKVFLLATIFLVNFVPVSSFANDDDLLLILGVPPIVAHAKKYHDCLGEAEVVCGESFDYCMMTVEEKISYNLQLCYETKVSCYSTCDDNYQECCDKSGLQECPEECRIQKRNCYTQCDNEGTQCTLDAINGNYEKPIESKCINDWTKCLERLKKVCQDL